MDSNIQEIASKKNISSMASKPIEMRWFRIIVKNQEYHRITDNFHEYLMKNYKDKTSFVTPKMPKAQASKTGINFMIFILIFVENFQ